MRRTVILAYYAALVAVGMAFGWGSLLIPFHFAWDVAASLWAHDTAPVRDDLGWIGTAIRALDWISAKTLALLWGLVAAPLLFVAYTSPVWLGGLWKPVARTNDDTIPTRPGG